jgi:hypothetical protein
MKTLLSLLFAVAVCCLLPSSGMAADEAAQTGEPANNTVDLDVKKGVIEP